METLLVWLPVTAITMFTVWFLWRLALLIKSDGYGFRSSSGLPKDWAPPDLPSTPYAAKPHF